jgi:rSAM/selenodomain-associated transferase 2
VVRLSVVIPAFQAAGELPRALEALEAGRRSGLVAEVVVADGGSSDPTPDLAEAAGARLVAAPRGRGSQLAAGAAAASGEWLLFLHADTALEPGWEEGARAFMAAAGSEGRAAVFRFAVDDPEPAARRLEAVVAWRCRVLGLPYGDQGLLLHRDLYRRVGGFRPLPLMEDVDIVRRIGSRRLELLEAAARTSAARYRRAGYLRRSLRNLACLGLYFLGVPPRLLVRLYG